MFCQNCGNEISERSTFCVHCGCSVENFNVNAGSVVSNEFQGDTGLLNDSIAPETNVTYAQNYYDGGNTCLLSEDLQMSENYYNSETAYQYDQYGNQNGVNAASVNTNFEQGQNINMYGNQSNMQNTVQQYAPIAQKPSLKDAYIKMWDNTSNYKGRARRSEYWNVVLLNAIVSIVASITVIGTPLMSLYAVACVPPMLSLVVRRLHDIGKEWYCMFLAFIPLAGPIIMIILLCKDSDPGLNSFGANPKELQK